MISQDHSQYALTYGLMLGIRVMVSDTYKYICWFCIFEVMKMAPFMPHIKLKKRIGKAHVYSVCVFCYLVIYCL